MGRVAFFLSLSLAAACSTSQTTESAATSPQPVTIVRAQQTSVPARFDAGGVVRARSTAVIASRILAPVLDVHVRAGARVKAGETLVTLDARELHAQAARATAAVAAARESVRAVEAEQEGAAAALRLAASAFERTNRLYAKGVAAGSELDEASAALDAARARVASVAAHVAEARGALDAASEAANAAAVSASYATITSPFDGIIAERLVDPGAMAAPGTPLLRAEDTTLYRLELSLDEARAHAVTVGQAATVHIAGASAEAVQGHVSEIASVDATGHTFLVKIDLPATPAIKSGLFGRARLTSGVRQVLAVPASAVLHRGQMVFVFVVDDVKVAHLRPVTLGDVSNASAEVLAGVEPGETIVDTPSPALVDGMRVIAGGGS